MARLEEMAGDNANISTQHQEWQALRRENDEDANDWSAFRDHLMAIGAPDPGEEEAEDFRTGESEMGADSQSA